MSKYDLNFQGNVSDNLPPNKRTTGFLDYLFGLVWPLQWRHDINFGSYWQGSSDPQYQLANTYTIGQRVVYWNQAGGSYYGDNAVYEANGSVPINTPPTAANQVDANGNGYWIQVQPNFMGEAVREMAAPNKITFEYLLNTWFHTTYRQPAANTWYGAPLIPAGKQVSDIFIVTNASNLSELYAFSTPQDFIHPTWQTSNKYLFSTPPPASPNDFTIYIPTAVWTALSPIAGNRDGIVRAFADKINTAGMIYNIVEY